MKLRHTICLLVALALSGGSLLTGQECCTAYKLVPQVTYKTVPQTVSQLVNETVMESQQVTTYKPIWTKETRQRRTIVMKPIVKTSEREERYLVRRPIIETSYRERQIEETSYETVTELREQRYLVQKPVVETQFREEQVVVRKPVTSTMMQTENVTTLKPVTVNETVYTQGATVQNNVVVQTGRNRLRWLSPGCYVDPVTGVTGFKRAGLHWVRDQNLAVVPTVTPTLIPQTVARTSYVPETVQVQKPVQVTQYVEQIETRRVPIQVTKTSSEILVKKIPVTVQKPVTKIRTERIPVQETRYKEEILVRRVPVTETTYQRVEQIEPYEVEVCKWVAETKEVKVPRTVTRRVDYTIDQVVPETVISSVPVDECGNVISLPAVASSTVKTFRYPIAERIISAPIVETYKPIASSDTAGKTVIGEPIIVRKLSDDEYPESKSILVPETETDADQPSSETTDVQDRSGSSNGNGNSVLEDEADKVPSLDDEENSSGLKIDSSDDADIDSRPGQTETDGDVTLNSSD